MGGGIAWPSVNTGGQRPNAAKQESSMLEDVVDGAVESVTGVWGLGLLVVATGALVASRSGLPAGKGALRGWFAARDKAAEVGDQARSFVAETGERIQDLYAEAKAEVRDGTAESARA